MPSTAPEARDLLTSLEFPACPTWSPSLLPAPPDPPPCRPRRPPHAGSVASEPALRSEDVESSQCLQSQPQVSRLCPLGSGTATPSPSHHLPSFPYSQPGPGLRGLTVNSALQCFSCHPSDRLSHCPEVPSKLLLRGPPPPAGENLAGLPVTDNIAFPKTHVHFLIPSALECVTVLGH